MGMADLQFLGLLAPAAAAAESVHHPVWNWSLSDVVLVTYLFAQAPSVNCIACMHLTYRKSSFHNTVLNAKQQIAKLRYDSEIARGTLHQALSASNLLWQEPHMGRHQWQKSSSAKAELYLVVNKDSRRIHSNTAHNSLLGGRHGCCHHKASKGRTSLEDLQHSFCNVTLHII